MAQQSMASRADVEARLIAKAQGDEAFAAELKRDPNEVVRRELKAMGAGSGLPDNVEVRVVEETPTTLYLVLPARPPAGDLSDADLELASGGKQRAYSWGVGRGIS